MKRAALGVCQSAGGTENLWELAAVINGRGDGELSKNYSKSIMHSKHVTKFNAVRTHYTLIDIRYTIQGAVALRFRMVLRETMN